MKAQITAKIITHSINPEGGELISIEAVAPYFLDAEICKHRMLAANSSSNRAIPFDKMMEADFYIPQDVRKNQKGMQGFEMLDAEEMEHWNFSVGLQRRNAVAQCLFLSESFNVHKQHLNRYLSPWSMQKKILTGTREAWNGVMGLRNHPDADPSIQIWAKEIQKLLDTSKPTQLNYGEWHLPYITREELEDYGNGHVSIETLRILSTARCAVTSYRLRTDNNTTLEAANNIFNFLVGSDPKHETPLCHQALCINPNIATQWPRGMTHMMKDGQIGSGELTGWIQHRHWK